MAKLSGITATSITYQEGSAPSTPASTKWVSYFKTDGQYYKDDAGVETGPLGAASGGAATGQMNQRATNVSVSQNTWADGPSLSLAAGTYILMGTITIQSGTTSACILGARISDGTNHLASTESKTETGSGSNPARQFALSGYVVVGSTTTWKIQGITSSASGATILAAATTNGSGNNASTLVALKIA